MFLLVHWLLYVRVRAGRVVRNGTARMREDGKSNGVEDGRARMGRGKCGTHSMGSGSACTVPPRPLRAFRGSLSAPGSAERRAERVPYTALRLFALPLAA